MAKVDDYEIKGINKEIRDFTEDVTTLLNHGKYAHPFLNAGPDWDARDGESAVFKSGNTKRYYLHLNTEWTAIDINRNLIASWLVFSGTDGAEVLNSFNVSSLTRHATGDFTISWDENFLDPYYVTTQGARAIFSGTSNNEMILSIDVRGGNPSEESIRILSYLWGTTSPILADPTNAAMLAIGVQ